jgi:anion-transporting  ArsA/GET3 family ATPase
MLPAPHRNLRSDILGTTVAVLLLVTTLGCLTTRAGSKKTEEPDKLARELAQSESAMQALQEEKSLQELQVFEGEAMIKQMEERLLSQQLLLDDAIQEVVRAKAKQRSLESRAEAASELAEAEIALKSFRTNAAGSNRPELSSAGQLLTMATQEFRDQNFGGTLYLVTQAKAQIKIGSLRVGEAKRAGGLEGEVPFAIPLQLKVNSRSNLREGPGEGFNVLVTLAEETALTGYSARGLWLRVKTNDGWNGWIHRSLVSSN